MPVIDHETHQTTIGSERYDACREKERRGAYLAPVGLTSAYSGSLQKHVQLAAIIDTSSTECRYDMSLTDPKCEGCHRRGSGEAYDRQIRSKGK